MKAAGARSRSSARVNLTVSLATDKNDGGAALGGVEATWFAVGECPLIASRYGQRSQPSSVVSDDCVMLGGTCDLGFCTCVDGAACACLCDQDQECPGGQFWDESVATCTPCPLGTAEPLAGSRTSCEPCAAGRKAMTSGSLYCVACSAEEYQNATGAHACYACPPNTERDITDTSILTGVVTEVLGVNASQCHCKEGYFVTDGSTGVLCKCPDGAICKGRSWLPCPEPGYWVDTRVGRCRANL